MSIMTTQGRGVKVTTSNTNIENLVIYIFFGADL